MGTAAIRPEERIGLLLAVALHAGLLAVLVMHPGGKPPPVPERIAVTISDDVALKSTSPEPKAQAAPETAPTLGETAPASVPEPSPLPMVKPAPPKPEPVKAVAKAVSEPEPKPEPKPVAKPLPRVQAKPEPVAKPSPAPKPAANARPAPPHAKPAAAPARAKTHDRPDPISEILSATRGQKAAKPVKLAGASRIGDDFLKGIPGGQSAGKSAVAPAQVIGAEEKAGLSSAIARQLKPHWVAPQGADAEQLVTILAWNLNADGTLDGTPRLVRQEGITDSNRPQAQRHVEQAIRAVELSAPFDLPQKFFPAWKRVAAFRFDRKLSQ